MHFGGCFGEFADKATIVWYVKLIPQPHTCTTMHNRQTPEVAYLCVYSVCVTIYHRYVPCIIAERISARQLIRVHMSAMRTYVRTWCHV